MSNVTNPAAPVINKLSGTPPDADTLPKNLATDFFASLEGLLPSSAAKEPSIRFDEYINRVLAKPELYLRNPAQYMVDAIESFGYEKVKIFGRNILAFNILKLPFASQVLADSHDYSGLTIPLYDTYLAFKTLAAGANPDRLVMFHGPRGCGKTTLSDLLFATLEDYSQQNPEGRLYQAAIDFNTPEKSQIGFITELGQVPPRRSKKPTEELTSGVNTDPIALLSNCRIAGRSAREALIDCAERLNRNPANISPGYRLYAAQLQLDSAFESAIDAISASTGIAPIKIVQESVVAQPFTYSLTQGRGLALVKPLVERHGTHQDVYPISVFEGRAAPRQIEGHEHSIHRLVGPILGAARGRVHFTDMLLVRDHEHTITELGHWNYLLDLIEGGKIQVIGEGGARVTNEKISVLLTADSMDSDILRRQTGSSWSAFQDRTIFVTVPMNRKFRQEEAALSSTFKEELKKTGRKAEPWALETIALFCVCTRLLKPNPEKYEKGQSKNDSLETLKTLLGKISVIEKAFLLQETEPLNSGINLCRQNGSRLSTEEYNLLLENIAKIEEEYRHGVGEHRFALYDGAFGMSTRGAKALVRRITQIQPSQPVTIFHILDYLESRSKAGFKFSVDQQNQMAAWSNYLEKDGSPKEQAKSQAAKDFPITPVIEVFKQVKSWSVARIQADVLAGLGASKEEQVQLVFERYLRHVVSYVTRTSVPQNFRTSHGRTDKPDEELMSAFESNYLATLKQKVVADYKGAASNNATDTLRQYLMNRLNSWASVHAGDDWAKAIPQIYEEIFEKVRETHQEEKRSQVVSFLEDIKRYADGKASLEADLANAQTKEQAQRYQHAWLALVNQGYIESTLPATILRAFEGYSA